jgi:hypothetical protein
MLGARSGLLWSLPRKRCRGERCLQIQQYHPLRKVRLLPCVGQRLPPQLGRDLHRAIFLLLGVGQLRLPLQMGWVPLRMALMLSCVGQWCLPLQLGWVPLRTVLLLPCLG